MPSDELKDVMHYLRQKQLDPQIQQETNQVYAILHIQQKEFTFFAKRYDESPLLQFIVFFPERFTKQTASEIARLLHYLNQRQDIPGFGMDEASGMVYIRCLVPLFDGKLNQPLFELFFEAIETACALFDRAIDIVGSGTKTFDEIKKDQTVMKFNA